VQFYSVGGEFRNFFNFSSVLLFARAACLPTGQDEQDARQSPPALFFIVINCLHLK
jgi:hypothetical protein